MRSLVVPQLVGPAVGGIRAHVAALAPALEERGLRAPVLGPDGVLGTLGEQAAVVDVRSVRHPWAWWSLRRQLEAQVAHADVLHAHGITATAAASVGSSRVPLVATVHNLVLPSPSGRTRRSASVLAESVLARADRLIVPSAAVLDGLPPRLRVRSRIVLPVVAAPVPVRDRRAVRTAWGVGVDTPVAVSVARLHPQKGLERLLRAWPSVRAQLPEAVLVLVGDGPERERLEALGGPGVRFVGASEHAADELAAADLLVVTSRWEAVPLVLVEAVALGVPVVSSPVGVTTEIATTDPTVDVVDPEDPEALAAAIGLRLERGPRSRPADARGLPPWADPVLAVDGVVAVYRELA